MKALFFYLKAALLLTLTNVGPTHTHQTLKNQDDDDSKYDWNSPEISRPSHWVDPLDPFSSSSGYISPEREAERYIQEARSYEMMPSVKQLCDCEKLEAQNNFLRKQASEKQNSSSLLPKCSGHIVATHTRFLSKLIARLKESSESYNIQDQHLLYWHISFTNQELSELLNTLKTVSSETDSEKDFCHSISRAEVTLSHIADRGKWSSDAPPIWITPYRITILYWVIGSVICFISFYKFARAFSRLSAKRQALLLVTVTFIVGYVWHCVLRLYETYVQKMTQSSYLEQCESAVPWLSALFYAEDPCTSYYRSVVINPMLEINPMIELMEYITRILVYPLRTCGQVSGQFFFQLLSPLPFYLKFIIIIVFLLMFIVTLFFICGYGIRMPFLVTLAPMSISQPTATLTHSVTKNSDSQNAITNPAIVTNRPSRPRHRMKDIGHLRSLSMPSKYCKNGTF